jgi:CRISPR-associated protein Cmr4
MIYLHALTPIHSGTGQAADVIDLPILREKITGWPLLPATSLKGVVRDLLTGGDASAGIARAFGTPDQAGTVCFADQRLLCFPVRSYYGTFAYVTCALALSRMLRDCDAADLAPPFATFPGEPEGNTVRIPTGSRLAQGMNVYFEDLDLRAEICAATEAVASGLGHAVFPESESERAGFVQRFALVSEEVFNFLCETATEVTARVSLEDETKTVRSGGLWYEEAVPAEAIFSGPVLGSGSESDADELFTALQQIKALQIGGKAGVGRGLCRMVVTA